MYREVSLDQARSIFNLFKPRGQAGMRHPALRIDQIDFDGDDIAIAGTHPQIGAFIVRVHGAMLDPNTDEQSFAVNATHGSWDVSASAPHHFTATRSSILGITSSSLLASCIQVLVRESDPNSPNCRACGSHQFRATMQASFEVTATSAGFKPTSTNLDSILLSNNLAKLICTQCSTPHHSSPGPSGRLAVLLSGVQFTSQGGSITLADLLD